jgi:hypothetical protein
MRERESFRHLMTVHPNGLYSSSEDFHSREWLDFNSIQSHKGFDYIDHLVSDGWNQTPPKPVLSSEGWYEDEPSMYDLPAWAELDPSWLQRFQAYWSVFHGSIGYVYGHGQVWKMRDESGIQGTYPERALNTEAPSQLAHLKNLVTHHAPSPWTPDQDLLTGSSRGSDFGRFYGTSPNLNCAIRSLDGSWAIVYSTRGMNVQLRTEKLAGGTFRYAWFNPRTGSWLRGSTVIAEPDWEPEPMPADAPTHWFSPPGGEVDANDWVLLIERAK